MVDLVLLATDRAWVPEPKVCVESGSPESVIHTRCKLHCTHPLLLSTSLLVFAQCERQVKTRVPAKATRICTEMRRTTMMYVGWITSAILRRLRGGGKD